MSRFIFDNVSKFDTYVNPEPVDIEFTKTQPFTLDDNSILTLSKKSSEHYKYLAKAYLESQDVSITKVTQESSLFPIEEYHNDYGTINSAIVSPYGHILIPISQSQAEVFFNGGCICKQGIQFRGVNHSCTSVITIASIWAEGIWHFPFEAFAALKSIPDSILYNSKIHISGGGINGSDYIQQWLNLIGINPSQIVTGMVYAKKLYVPRMGKCGNPYYSQMMWVKSVIYRNITLYDEPVHCIIVKRTKRRPIVNYDELYTFVKEYSEANDLILYEHNDSSLPPLKTQQQVFHRAKIVFAPHGAGGIHLAAMKSGSANGNGSRYIEFLNEEDINLCYARLAYLYDIHYTGITIKNGTVPIEKLREAF